MRAPVYALAILFLALTLPQMQPGTAHAAPACSRVAWLDSPGPQAIDLDGDGEPDAVVHILSHNSEALGEAFAELCPGASRAIHYEQRVEELGALGADALYYAHVYTGVNPWGPPHTPGPLPLGLGEAEEYYLNLDYSVHHSPSLPVAVAARLFLAVDPWASEGLGPGGVEVQVWLYWSRVEPRGEFAGTHIVGVYVNGVRAKIAFEAWLHRHQWTTVILRSTAPLQWGSIGLPLGEVLDIALSTAGVEGEDLKISMASIGVLEYPPIQGGGRLSFYTNPPTLADTPPGPPEPGPFSDEIDPYKPGYYRVAGEERVTGITAPSIVFFAGGAAAVVEEAVIDAENAPLILYKPSFKVEDSGSLVLRGALVIGDLEAKCMWGAELILEDTVVLGDAVLEASDDCRITLRGARVYGALVVEGLPQALVMEDVAVGNLYLDLGSRVVRLEAAGVVVKRDAWVRVKASSAQVELNGFAAALLHLELREAKGSSVVVRGVDAERVELVFDKTTRLDLVVRDVTADSLLVKGATWMHGKIFIYRVTASPGGATLLNIAAGSRVVVSWSCIAREPPEGEASLLVWGVHGPGLGDTVVLEVSYTYFGENPMPLRARGLVKVDLRSMIATPDPCRGREPALAVTPIPPAPIAGAPLALDTSLSVTWGSGPARVKVLGEGSAATGTSSLALVPAEPGKVYYEASVGGQSIQESLEAGEAEGLVASAWPERIAVLPGETVEVAVAALTPGLAPAPEATVHLLLPAGPILLATAPLRDGVARLELTTPLLKPDLYQLWLAVNGSTTPGPLLEVEGYTVKLRAEAQASPLIPDNPNLTLTVAALIDPALPGEAAATLEILLPAVNKTYRETIALAGGLAEANITVPVPLLHPRGEHYAVVRLLDAGGATLAEATTPYRVSVGKLVRVEASVEPAKAVGDKAVVRLVLENVAPETLSVRVAVEYGGGVLAEEELTLPPGGSETTAIEVDPSTTVGEGYRAHIVVYEAATGAQLYKRGVLLSYYLRAAVPEALVEARPGDRVEVEVVLELVPPAWEPQGLGVEAEAYIDGARVEAEATVSDRGASVYIRVPLLPPGDHRLELTLKAVGGDGRELLLHPKRHLLVLRIHPYTIEVEAPETLEAESGGVLEVELPVVAKGVGRLEARVVVASESLGTAVEEQILAEETAQLRVALPIPPDTLEGIYEAELVVVVEGHELLRERITIVVHGAPLLALKAPITVREEYRYGEELRVDIAIANQGTATGKAWARLLIDNTLYAEEEAQVDPKTTQVLSLATTIPYDLTVGRHRLAVEVVDDQGDTIAAYTREIIVLPNPTDYHIETRVHLEERVVEVVAEAKPRGLTLTLQLKPADTQAPALILLDNTPLEPGKRIHRNTSIAGLCGSSYILVVELRAADGTPIATEKRLITLQEPRLKVRLEPWYTVLNPPYTTTATAKVIVEAEPPTIVGDTRITIAVDEPQVYATIVNTTRNTATGTIEATILLVALEEPRNTTPQEASVEVAAIHPCTAGRGGIRVHILPAKTRIVEAGDQLLIEAHNTPPEAKLVIAAPDTTTTIPLRGGAEQTLRGVKPAEAYIVVGGKAYPIAIEKQEEPAGERAQAQPTPLHPQEAIALAAILAATLILLVYLLERRRST